MFRRFFRWLFRIDPLKGRLLFRFHDGVQDRAVDPFVTFRRLQSLVDVETIEPLASAGQEPEATDFAVAISKAFGVERWDEQTQSGLTDWELQGLLVAFTEYLDELKKNSSPGPTSSSPTGSESSTSQEPPPKTTSCSSGSGATATAPTAAPVGGS